MTDATIGAEKQAELDATRSAAIGEIEAAADERALEAARVAWLGKSGKVSALRKNIGKLPPAEKPLYGAAINAILDAVEGALTARGAALARAKLEAELSGPKLDVTLPGRALGLGRRHPVSRTLDDIVAIFQRMGFQVASGPELELDFYNFEALAVPKDHPARDMQDTFYVDEAALPTGAVPPGELLLRTHTSPVQIRTMLAQRPPVRIIAPGRVYRCDSDQTHTPQFHQVEGLYVDRHVTFAELKGTIAEFLRALIGPTVKTRFRPSFFPFTEPSAEFDMSCHGCGGEGRTAAGACRLCKATGWIEIGGAGMVDPEVFRHVGYDAEELSGFAFGLGVERMTMLRYGIDDLRTMFENDLRFLHQF